MIPAGDLAQGLPGFNCNLAVGFRSQRQHHFSRINIGVDIGQAFRHTLVCDQPVEISQQLDFIFGVPGDTFTTITHLRHQGTERSEFLVGVGEVANHLDKVRHGFTRNRITFTLLPVLNVQRLAQFRRRIVQNRQCHDIGFRTEMAYHQFRIDLCQSFVNIPVAAAFPGGIDSARQGVNKRMHIGGIEVVLFIPG